MITREKPKYIVIAEEIKKGISEGLYQPDDYLPSQNDLIRTYGVSLATIRRSIEHLVKTGWARSEKGKGVFAKSPTEAARVQAGSQSRNVGLASIGWFHGAEMFFQILMNGAVPALKSADMDVQFSEFRADDQLYRRFESFLDGILKLLLFGEFDRRILEILKSRSIKTVVLGSMRPPDALLAEFNRVSYDPEMAGIMTAEVLAKRGHRQIVLACDDQSDRDRIVREGFVRGCAENEITKYDFCTIEDAAEVEAAARRIARSNHITGIAVKGDPQACDIIAHLFELGVHVPSDKEVVCIGGVARQSLAVPDLPRIEFDGKQWGQEAVRILLSDTNVVVHKLLPVRFVPGYLAEQATKNAGANTDGKASCD